MAETDDMRVRRPQAVPGTGQLGPRLVLHHARGMVIADFGRIAGAAFVFFVPPACLHFGAEAVHDGYAHSAGTGRVFLLTAFVALVTVIRLLGEVFFAGYLDLAVGETYFKGERRSFSGVLADLPWRPLLVADFIVAVGAVIGLLFFVIPGLVVFTLFGLVGPVVVQERRKVGVALKRTYQISRPHWRLIFVLVLIPLGIEHALAEALRLAVEDDGIVWVVAVEWFIAATMLGLVGVLNVALATELLARTPEVSVPDVSPPEVP